MLVGLGVGAGLMYLLDSHTGNRRRAFLRNKAGRLYQSSETFAQKAARDFSNRASGVAAGARSLLQHEDATDEKIMARIRSRLGCIVSHPHAIHVSVENGRAVLSGPVLASESGALLRAIEDIPGVKGIESRLEVHETTEHVPSLQGGYPRRGNSAEFFQKNWTPAIRCTAATVGSGLALYGLRSKGPWAKVSTTLGLGLVARGLSNQELTNWADLAPLRRTLHV
jgi:hypothetical protein